MKLVFLLIVGLMASLFAAGGSQSRIPELAAADESLRSFLGRFEEATSRFVNGDPAPWKQNASRRDDATILGAWGSYAKGWKDVSARYDWASSRMAESGAKVKVEYISSGASGDLAYTVAIERSEMRLADQQKPAPMALRVTHIFRKEDGAWKLVHRHADPLVGETAPPTVFKK